MAHDRVKLTMLIIVLFCFRAPLLCETTTTAQSTRLATTSELVRRESSEILAAASEMAAIKREEYQKSLSKKVQDLQPKIDELKMKAKAASGNLRKDLLKQLELTEDNRKLLRARIDEMSSSSEEAWEDVKAGMDSALDDMQKALDKARSRFR